MTLEETKSWRSPQKFCEIGAQIGCRNTRLFRDLWKPCLADLPCPRLPTMHGRFVLLLKKPSVFGRGHPPRFPVPPENG